MVRTLPLMLERVRRYGSTEPDHDAEIIADCRRTVNEILRDAEGTLDALIGNGWHLPDDDDVITYAARLLLLVDRPDELMRAIAIAQDLTFGTEDKNGDTA